jgi:hypothetical protein
MKRTSAGFFASLLACAPAPPPRASTLPLPAPPPPAPSATREVVTTDEDGELLAETYTLESLKLLAIVSGPAPRIMLIDPSQKAWTAKRGDFVGRTSASTCHWRVADIRSDEVVFAPYGETCAANPKTLTIKLAR